MPFTSGTDARRVASGREAALGEDGLAGEPPVVRSCASVRDCSPCGINPSARSRGTADNRWNAGAAIRGGAPDLEGCSPPCAGGGALVRLNGRVKRLRYAAAGGIGVARRRFVADALRQWQVDLVCSVDSGHSVWLLRADTVGTMACYAAMRRRLRCPAKSTSRWRRSLCRRDLFASRAGTLSASTAPSTQETASLPAVGTHLRQHHHAYRILVLELDGQAIDVPEQLEEK